MSDDEYITGSVVKNPSNPLLLHIQWSAFSGATGEIGGVGITQSECGQGTRFIDGPHTDRATVSAI